MDSWGGGVEDEAGGGGCFSDVSEVKGDEQNEMKLR